MDPRLCTRHRAAEDVGEVRADRQGAHQARVRKVKLKNITPTHARALYREKLDSGLAPRTVNYIHTTLSKALKDAVSDGLIPRNPASW